MANSIIYGIITVNPVTLSARGLCHTFTYSRALEAIDDYALNELRNKHPKNWTNDYEIVPISDFNTANSGYHLVYSELEGTVSELQDFLRIDLLRVSKSGRIDICRFWQVVTLNKYIRDYMEERTELMEALEKDQIPMMSSLEAAGDVNGIMHSELITTEKALTVIKKRDPEDVYFESDDEIDD